MSARQNYTYTTQEMWLEIELDVRVACGNDVENLFYYITIVFWSILSITNLNSLLNNLRTTVITYKPPFSYGKATSNGRAPYPQKQQS